MLKNLSKEKIAAMSYLWILCFIPFIISKDEFVRFHAKQGFVLFVIEVLLVFVGWIPIIGQILIVLIIITAVLGFRSAIEGKKWEIPFVYELSKKINIK
ncbi:MAG: hypothetical protein PHZ07_01960 [Patescibacteria group bacterium]|nr:hypothetical protein [Patescibacteria group bacterium]MDD4304049.1 hypothetical protein [Patescibacteria group bacterium]MDD4694926.1 hypothetical protein [Patescibacteria group bacterium]